MEAIKETSGTKERKVGGERGVVDGEYEFKVADAASEKERPYSYKLLHGRARPPHLVTARHWRKQS